jgi:DNA ligase-1
MKTLMHFKNFYEEIRTSNSRKFKQDILQKYKDDEQIRFYLHFAFNPYITTGISFKKLGKIVGGSNIKHLNSIPEFLTYLSQHNTGTDQVVSLCQELISNAAVQVDRDAANLLELLICKDLSIGCDVKTINSIIPGLIPQFSVQLAEKYFDKPEKVEGKEFAITTKIDGGRIIAIKENGQVSFFTRAGQKYEGLVELEQEMTERLPDNYVLDGEITLLDYKNYDSKTAYKLAMKITRADGPKSGVKMLVFDGMPLSDWKTQQSSLTYLQRRQMLDCMTGFYNDDLTYFELLPILYLGSDTSKILELLESETDRNQEGIMINICDAPYEFKRTWNLMKVKKMNTVDLEIVGFEEGSGRLAGTLGAIHVRYKDGNIVKVGSGFSDELRDLIWKKAFLEQPDLCKIVEIQYFEETTNADGGISLRFPVFKDFRPDKTEADF